MAASATVTFGASRGSGTNTSSYTFLAQSTGTASATRVVVYVVTISFPAAGGTRTISCTLDGNAMTQVAQQFITGVTTRTYNTFFALAWSTGTTADFVVSTGSNVERCLTKSYATTNVGSLTPTATSSSTASPSPLDLNVNAGGIIIAVGSTNENDNTGTWTGLNGNSQSSTENRTQSVASDAFASAQTPADIEIAWADAATDNGGLAISLPGLTGTGAHSFGFVVGI